MTLEKTLKAYKNSEENLLRANTPKHPLYWLMVTLVQSGGGTTIDMLAKQFEITIEDLEGLVAHVKTVVPDFPLETLFTSQSEHIVRIPHTKIDTVRNVLAKIAPEDLPPDKLIRHDESGETDVPTTVLIEAFQKEQEDSSALQEWLIKIFRGIKGFENPVPSKNHDDVILTDLPEGWVITKSISGRREVGYFADKDAVLDVSYIANCVQAETILINQVVPIIVSLGFTKAAQHAALQISPKVCLIPMWAFAKLLDYLQRINNLAASNEAFFLAYHYLETNHRINYDGYITETLAELEKIYGKGS